MAGWCPSFGVTRTDTMNLAVFVRYRTILDGAEQWLRTFVFGLLREGSMNKRLSPDAAGKRVLRAFPFPKVGAVISHTVIEEYFRRRGLPFSTMNLGIQYATQVGWIKAAALQSVELLEAGMDEIAQPPLIPGMPQSVWHSWAYR